VWIVLVGVLVMIVFLKIKLLNEVKK